LAYTYEKYIYSWSLTNLSRDSGVQERIILKRSLNKQGMRVWSGLKWHGDLVQRCAHVKMVTAHQVLKKDLFS
jgi:hypothetical protein